MYGRVNGPTLMFARLSKCTMAINRPTFDWPTNTRTHASTMPNTEKRAIDRRGTTTRRGNMQVYGRQEEDMESST